MLSEFMMARIVDRPSFKARNGSIRNITRIELTPECTKVYIHAIFRPKWWIMEGGDTYLEDTATGKHYPLKHTEGIEINKKTFMPESGEMDFVLIFEPLPEETSTVNLISPDSNESNTYDILLDTKNRELQPLKSVEGNWFADDGKGDWRYGIYDSLVIMNNSLHRIMEYKKKRRTIFLKVKDCNNESTSILRLVPQKNGSCLIAVEGEEPKLYLRTRPMHLAVEPDKGYGEDFFHGDSICIQGYIDGYDRRLGFDSGIIYFRDMITRKDYPIVVPINSDGTFICKQFLKYPICHYLTLNNNWIPFYAEPGQTVTMYISWEDVMARSRARDNQYPLVNTAHMGGNTTLSYLTHTLASCFNYPFGKLEKAQKTLTPDQFVDHLKPTLEQWQHTADSLCRIYATSLKAITLIRNQKSIRTGTTYFEYQMSRDYFALKDTANPVLKVNPSRSYYDFLKDMPLDNKTLLVNNPIDIFINRFEYMDPLTDIYYKKDFMGNISNKIKSYPEKYRKVWTEILIDEARDSVINEMLGSKNLFLWEVAKVRDLSQSLKSCKDRSQAIMYIEETKKHLSHPYLVDVVQDILETTIKNDKTSSYQLPEGKATDIFRRIISPHTGKILFIDFWGIYCGPCRAGIEATAGLRKKYHNHPEFQFVYITGESDSPEKSYNDYVEKNLKGEACYRISDTEYSYMRQLFQFNGIPHYILVEKDGSISTEDVNTYNLEYLLKQRFGE